jgi:hypothetical protein
LIGNDEVKALRCRPKGFQGLSTAEADDDLIAEALEQRLPQAGHSGLIIDQQEPLLPCGDRLCSVGAICCSHLYLR